MQRISPLLRSRLFTGKTRLVTCRYNATLKSSKNEDSEPVSTINGTAAEKSKKLRKRRGYEREFFKKFYYLPPRNTGGGMDIAELMEEGYKDQLESIQIQTADPKPERFNQFALTEETVFYVAGMYYNPQTFMDLTKVKDKYLPEAWPGRIDEYEFTWINRKETLARYCYTDIMWKLKGYRKDGFLKSKGCEPIYIDGLNGTGKSVGLFHVVLFARAENWLTLYVPKSKRLFDKARIKPSKTRKWIYDMHEAAVQLLTDFRDAHHDKLAKLPMRTNLPNIEQLETFNQSRNADTSLLDLIEYGITCDNPSEVFIAVRNELDAVTEYPVLIAVDDVNALVGNTGFMKPIHLLEEKIEWVYGNEISVLLALNRPEKSTLVNGTYVCALTMQHPKKDFLKQIGEKDFNANRMEIPSYSLEEYEIRVQRYLQGDVATRVSKMTKDYIYQLCSGRPKHIAHFYATMI